jgi:hypothetical protein
VQELAWASFPALAKDLQEPSKDNELITKNSLAVPGPLAPRTFYDFTTIATTRTTTTTTDVLWQCVSKVNRLFAARRRIV